MDCSVFICAEKCHFHWIDKCFCDMIHIGAIYDTNGEEKFMLISGKIITGILTAAVMAAGNAAKGKWNHVTGRKYVCDDGTADGCCL